MREHTQVFLFFGNQNLLIDEQVFEVTNKILLSDTRDLGFQRFSIEEILKGNENEGQFSELIQSLKSLPFLEESRVLRLDNIERIKAPRSQSDKSKATRLIHAIVNFLNSPKSSHNSSSESAKKSFSRLLNFSNFLKVEFS